jgi:WD40 repeat protein
MAWIGVAALTLLPPIAAGDRPTHLEYSHKIGFDWKADSNQWMNFVAFGPDGKTVAANGNIAGAMPGQMGIWSFPGGQFLRRVGSARPLAISADFRYVATGSGVFELQTGKPVLRTPPHAGCTQAASTSTGEEVALAADGPIAEGGRGQISVLKTSDGSMVASFGARRVSALAIHPDNRTLAAGQWNSVVLWDMRAGQRSGLLDGFDLNVYGIGFSRDGRFLAAGTENGQPQIWDVVKRTRRHTLQIGIGDVSTPAFSPDGKLVAAGTYADGTLSLIDVSTGKVLAQIQVSMYGCGSVAFSPDGQYLAVPSNPGLVGRRYQGGGSIQVFRVAN